ncbi:hypothetical protein [Crocosphaera sp.]|uniref:hypothetical protein n=1 Tax=Crocosphaera sp. TaxID=2729996 RepID=UPI002608720B|nr:hypothetical protein [Crocosphaera sp.]MDJ0579076.1 hypothetical protein [Crocosphaera sp.]
MLLDLSQFKLESHTIEVPVEWIAFNAGTQGLELLEKILQEEEDDGYYLELVKRGGVSVGESISQKAVFDSYQDSVRDYFRVMESIKSQCSQLSEKEINGFIDSDVLEENINGVIITKNAQDYVSLELLNGLRTKMNKLLAEQQSYLRALVVHFLNNRVIVDGTIKNFRFKQEEVLNLSSNLIAEIINFARDEAFGSRTEENEEEGNEMETEKELAKA